MVWCPFRFRVASRRLVGHSDKGNIVPSWNSSHPSRGCSRESLGRDGWQRPVYVSPRTESH